MSYNHPKAKIEHRNLKVVPQLVFGRGSVQQLSNILNSQRSETGSPIVFLIDDALEHYPWVPQLPIYSKDLVIFVSVDHEPKTQDVDRLVERIKSFSNRQADAIVGIGGGSTMDLTKAVSLLLTNPGSATDYQGWDLVKYPGIYKIALPSLAGTGAEISRTAVLTGPERKLGINSDFTPFDQIIMDPDLTTEVPTKQRFYTAMDCFIHGTEALNGAFINEFSRAYAEKSMDLCREVFLSNIDRESADEKLMIASYFGGLSIAYSQVGICHALSYGLSFVLGTRHGIGNCIVFDQLEDYYPREVAEFRRMLEIHQIELPRGLTCGLSEDQFIEMIRVALSLELLWENALGHNWQQLMPPEQVRSLYEKM